MDELERLLAVMPCPHCSKPIDVPKALTVQIRKPHPDDQGEIVARGVMCSHCDQPIFVPDPGSCTPALLG
jgi:hypothetical protein